MATEIHHVLKFNGLTEIEILNEIGEACIIYSGSWHTAWWETEGQTNSEVLVVGISFTL